MDQQSLNILCATDDYYVPYCGVMLTSLFDSNSDKDVNVFVIIDKPLSKANKNRFQRLSARYGQTIEYVMIDKNRLLRFPTKGMDYWSIAMYYRIFAEELLPKELDRVLYLDCDIIVRGSLSPLWDIDMTDKAVGVVPDIFTFYDDCYKRLQYPQDAGYFNSGVLLMNLKYWRQNKICQQCLNYLCKNYERLFANDQDVLNAVLWNRKMQLPIKYNYQVQFLKDYFYHQEIPTLQKEILQTKENPIVIHYALPIKPWNILYYKMPYKCIWWQVKRKSQWWYLLPQLPQKKMINYLIKRYILWPLGIMWNAEYTIAKELNNK